MLSLEKLLCFGLIVYLLYLLVCGSSPHMLRDDDIVGLMTVPGRPSPKQGYCKPRVIASIPGLY